MNLEIGFENESWREILTRKNGKHEFKVVPREGDSNCLELMPGTFLETQLFPYVTGDIEISADVFSTAITPGGKPYHTAWFSVHLFDRDRKSIGHRDLFQTPEPTPWTRKTMTLRNLKADAAYFQLRVGNHGRSGIFRVDNIAVKIRTNGSNLCGDPGFRGDFAVDHWHNPREGMDWDGLKLSGGKENAKYVADVFPDGGRSLHLRNTATFLSNRFEYDGGALLFGGWTKLTGIRPGAQGWAWANIQLATFDADGEKIGHVDLTPHGISNQNWQYFSMLIPEGKLNRGVKSVQLYLRIFDGATGEACFDEIQLVKFPTDDSDAPPYQADRVTIAIDAKTPSPDPIRPVWDAVDISYISKTAHPPARTALTELRQAGVTHLRLREFLQGGGILKQIDSGGEPVYSWETLDRWTDWLVIDQGFILTPTIESTPNQIASVPDKNPRIYCNRSTPADIDMWGRIVEDLIEHWIGRYGIDTVSRWNFECWNEPYTERYFKGTNAEFVQIYHEYIDALSRVEQRHDSKLNIGTISGINNSPLFRLTFDETKKRGELDKIRFLSMHIYAGFVNSFDLLKSGIRRIRELADSYPELSGIPLSLTEVHGASMGNVHHDMKTAAAFNVKANRVYLDENVERGYFFTPIDYMFRDQDKYFKSDLGLFTANGIPKAAFNSIVLLNRLSGGKRLPLRSSNEPGDGIAVIEGDNLRILLTTFDERSLNKEGEVAILLSIDLPEGKTIDAAKLTRIDTTHANSHTKWLELGKPVVSPETDALLKEANQLQKELLTGWEMENGKAVLTITMELNSVGFLELQMK